MQIFIDSADIDDIEQAFSWGIVGGVTTNPALIKAAVEKHGGGDLASYIEKILRTVRLRSPSGREGTVSLEVIAEPREKETIADAMEREAMTLYKRFNRVADNVVIKIPINPARADGDDRYAGIKAASFLSRKDVRTNVTLVHSAAQALLAAEAGATYVSPFLGGVDDSLVANQPGKHNKQDYYPVQGREALQSGHIEYDRMTGVVSGVHLLQTIADMYQAGEYKTKILAASLRNPRQVVEAACAGAHLATIPFPVLEKMLDHPLTLERMNLFTKATVPEYRKLFGDR